MPKDQGEDKRYRRSITIAPENSKTGVGRKIVAPVGEQFERIKKIYKSIGVECGKDDVFQHTAKTRRGKNIVRATLMKNG